MFAEPESTLADKKTSNFVVRVKTKHERFERNKKILIFYHKILLF